MHQMQKSKLSISQCYFVVCVTNLINRIIYTQEKKLILRWEIKKYWEGQIEEAKGVTRWKKTWGPVRVERNGAKRHEETTFSSRAHLSTQTIYYLYLQYFFSFSFSFLGTFRLWRRKWNLGNRTFIFEYITFLFN